MESSAVVAAAASDLLGVHGLWLLFSFVLAFLWSSRELGFMKRISMIEAKNLADLSELARLQELRIETMKKNHQRDLVVLRESKKLVWFSVTENGEVFECPGCGHRQRTGNSGKH